VKRPLVVLMQVSPPSVLANGGKRVLGNGGKRVLGKAAESGSRRTPIPAQGGQHSGDCGQRVMAA
jgi:hypothetical protein